MREKIDLYPDYSAYINYIDNNGISTRIIQKIINKHRYNRKYNKDLYERYQAIANKVPIFEREPRFDEKAPINNKINDDFFGEIVDFKVGYFVGKPIAYSYSRTDESEEATGGKEAVNKARKAISDFVTRNNMFDVDMEITKYASICGYSGRLLYIDLEGNERVMPVAPYETIVLSDTEITEPKYAVRYYETRDINDNILWKAEFYDSADIYYYEGQLSGLKFIKKKPHLFDYCPLQGIPNNREMLGDAEKVLSLIDAYDRTMSDNSNDIESFSNAYMIFENINLTEEEVREAQKTGSFSFYNSSGGRVYFLTKDVNDTFSENHLNRIEDNIYRFSKTPNLTDETFGNGASGVSLKFKLTGLETKCGMFQAKMQSAGIYMFKVLASGLRKRTIKIDPLQCIMEFTRNFPLDLLSEAQAAQQLIAAGLPKEVAFTSALSFIDDIDYVMRLIEQEKNSIPPLTEDYNAYDDFEYSENGD